MLARIRVAPAPATETRAATRRAVTEEYQPPSDFDHTSWRNATFESPRDAREAHMMAMILHGGALAEVLDIGRDFVDRCQLTLFMSFLDLHDRVDVMADIQEAFEQFLPSIVDAPIETFLRAYSRVSSAMGGLDQGQRAELKASALEYVRPGVTIDDLDGAMAFAGNSLSEWRLLARKGAHPQVPPDLDGVHDQMERIYRLLVMFDEVLGLRKEKQFVLLPIDQLKRELAALASEGVYFQPHSGHEVQSDVPDGIG